MSETHGTLSGPLRPTGNGRDVAGRFTLGNPGGPGAAAHRRTVRARELQAALVEAVTSQDIADVIRALVAQAKSGDVSAARELLDRCLGRPAQLVAVEPADPSGQVEIVVQFDDAG